MLVLRHPFADPRLLEGEVERIFNHAFGHRQARTSGLLVTSNADAAIIRAELPGVDPAQIHVTVEKGILTIRGERREENRQATPVLRERAYGAFAHTVRLSDELDTEAIVAECRDGVLTVRIPKRPAAKPRQIEVKAS
jgi:HSP20 family protein